MYKNGNFQQIHDQFSMHIKQILPINYQIIRSFIWIIWIVPPGHDELISSVSDPAITHTNLELPDDGAHPVIYNTWFVTAKMGDVLINLSWPSNVT